MMNLPYSVVFLLLTGIAIGSYIGFIFPVDEDTVHWLVLSAVWLAHVLVVCMLAEWAVTKWKRKSSRRVYK